MIYLDHAATSPLRPEVRAAMEPWWGVPANPSSVHRAGQRARAAVEEAREHVAALVGGRPEGVVFTSGATEANHLFVAGAATRALSAGQGRRAWVTSPVEHPCVLDAVARLEARGLAVRRLAVGRDGVCQVDALGEDVIGLSLMAVNHETGVLQPVEEALAAARAVGAVLHVDATQAAGKRRLALGDVDGVVISGHKLGGPPGVGALILKDGEPFPSLLGGGAQERGRRAGTVPTALAAGLGAASRSALEDLEERQEWIRSLTWILEAGVRELGGEIVGAPTPDPDPSPEGSASSSARSRIEGHTLAVFPDCPGEQLVQALDVRSVCVSSGAACASGSVEASPVLTAMAHPRPADGVRFTLGWSTTREDVLEAVRILGEVVRGVQAARALGDW